MNERLLNEFSIYYKRVIRLERYLKDLILDKYISAHHTKAYNMIFNSYFLKIEKKRPKNDNIFSEIRLKRKTDIEKLKLSVDKLYLSEVLSFFNHKIYLKNSVRKTFFNKPTETNKDSFKHFSKLLKNFRNCICHFDEKQFLIEKTRFIEALLFFEKLLDCRYKFTSGSIESISHKLNTKSILELIYQNNPEYFDDDRILVNVFDDIAVLAGYRTDKLPPYKSIIRAKFKIQEDKKNTQKKSLSVATNIK